MSDISQLYANTSWGKDAQDDAIIFDGMQDFSGGVDAFRRATLIDPNQCQNLQNVIVRDNYEARTRPGADILGGGTYIGVPVTMPSNYVGHLTNPPVTANTRFAIVVGANEVGAGARVVFPNGGSANVNMSTVGQVIIGTSGNPGFIELVNGSTQALSAAVTAVVYELVSTACLGLRYFDTPQYEQLLAAFNGTLWKFEGGAWSQVTWPLAANKLAWAQGVDQLLISDGSNNHCQTYDGVTVNDGGGGVNDPPIGSTILTFHQGCMFASGLPASNNSAQYGVPVFADTIMVSNSLSFGSGQWNAVTRSFRIGNGDGEGVVAIASMQDTTLCVFKTDSIWLVNTGNAPTPTSFTANNAVAALTQGLGIVGRDAWTAVQNDILFFSARGIFSVQRMQAAAGQWQLTAPLSQPIQPFIDRINTAFWDNICAETYQEFAFFFVPLDISTVNNAVLVYNWRLQKWLGVWTNWSGQATEVTRFQGVNRLVFGGLVGDVNMWKDYASLTDDGTYTDNGSGYGTIIATRSFQHQDLVLDKSPYTSTVRFTAGNATVAASWISDLVTQKTWSVAPTPTGDILGVGTLPFLLESTAPSRWDQGLRAAPDFNEGYIQLETQAGWIFVRSIYVGAQMQAVKEYG